MEIQGRIEKMLPLKTGKSANGEWKRQEFIVNYFERPTDIYYKRIVLGVMNERIDELKLEAGDEIKARWDIRVNERNGTAFNDVRTGAIEVLKRANPDKVATPSKQTEQQSQQTAEPAKAAPASDDNANTEEDDLPF